MLPFIYVAPPPSIKSALMTTAYNVDSADDTINDMSGVFVSAFNPIMDGKIENPTQTGRLILDSACRRFPRKPQHNVRADSCKSVARLAYQVSVTSRNLPNQIVR